MSVIAEGIRRRYRIQLSASAARPPKALAPETGEVRSALERKGLK